MAASAVANDRDQKKQNIINCNVQPEIPDWALKKSNSVVLHNNCGIIDDPSKILAQDIFNEEDFLDGEEFVRRGQALKGALNACGFDFFSRLANWKYLEHVPEKVIVLVFTQTVFLDSRGRRCVRCLYRRKTEWYPIAGRLSEKFRPDSWVACLGKVC